MKWKCIFVIALIAFSGCATKVTGLKKSNAFNYNNVKLGRIAVGGVTSAVERLNSREQTTYGNLLKAQILEERGSLSVASVGVLKKKLGKRRYNELMSEYEELGTVGPEWYSTLNNKIKRQRFLIFARIENNDVDQDRTENTQYDSNGNPDYTNIVSKTSRAITASIQVLDLKNQEVAWSGTITKTLSNSRNYRRREEMGIVKLVKAIKGTQAQSKDAKYPFPAAPKTKNVLARLFMGFGENLPEKD